MKFKIKGKEHDVLFNIRFVRNLNKKFVLEQYGLEIGVGLQSVLPRLNLKDITALADVIHAGIYPTASEKAVEEAIEAYGEEHGDFEGLFNQVGKQLLKAPATKVVAKQMQQEMEEG